MDLAVILLNWRNEQQTRQCARAVLSWQALNPHLIVVDNESTEAGRRILSNALPTSDIVFSAVNIGYGGGNNLGIKRALALDINYILLLNTDCEISVANIIRLLDRLDAHPDISILGPVIQEGDEAEMRRLVGGRNIAEHSYTRIAIPLGDVKRLPDYPVHEVDYVSGTVFLVRGSVFKDIGMLDEEYFFSGEIADFCKRAKDRGYKVCVDLEVEARHDRGQTSTHLRETLYVYYGLRNRFLYVNKHHSRKKIAYFAYWTLVGAAGLARAMCRCKIAKARAIALALLDGYRGRFGNQNAKFP